MITPNIEGLIARLQATNQFCANADIRTADVIAALQTQAERIKELEPIIQNQIVKDISKKPCHK